MKTIVINQPRRFVFGNGCLENSVQDLAESGYRRVFVVSSPPIREVYERFCSGVEQSGGKCKVFDAIDREPDIAMFEATLAAAESFQPDAVVGLGGGSVLDVSKLVAAMIGNPESVKSFFGIGFLPGREIPLICLPTTAGTGSEVSPNAILLDEAEALKKGVVSPHLMPDRAYIDPELTWSVPPAVTAATGVDAMTHCIEALANQHAHSLIDNYALIGIEHIARSLEAAIADGKDEKARSDVALGSVYGGICLGPVNTGGVHALSYPLGGEFHIAHGVSNAILLPHVLRFNLPNAVESYARMARAFGISGKGSDVAYAEAGIEWVEAFVRRCGIPQHLAEFNIEEGHVAHLAREAMKVTRLLVNNPREITMADAESIYRAAL